MFTNIKLLLLIVLLASCTKGWEDIQIPEQKKVFIESNRYTSTWVYYKTVTVEIKGVDWQPYCGLKPDTLISTCSIDKIDSNFRIEIRKYLIK